MSIPLLWIPPRGSLPQCYVNANHIISLYYGNCSVFIELSNKKTVELSYANNVQAINGWDWFRRCLILGTQIPGDYPEPTGGNIRSFV